MTSPNGYDFTPYKLPVIENGKHRWRDCLNLVLSRRDVVLILQQLANSLDFPETQLVTLGFCGWLEKCEEGDWPFDEVAQ